MRALTVLPGQKDSLEVVDLPEPEETDGAVLVQGLAVGLCGTDQEIVGGAYGEAPEGSERLVLGHENLGRVLAAPDGCGLAEGDLVVGIVRRPDPVPCPPCSIGQWDMCRNGRYLEHGIKGLHGFARERWRVPADGAVRLDPGLGEVGVLLEPTTVVAKAWQQVARIGARAWWDPHVAVVTGAGPVGLLAALLAVQQGLEVHVFDLAEDGPKPDLVRRLGATYHSTPLGDTDLQADVLVECTGVPQVVMDVQRHGAVDGITCLTGVSSGGERTAVDVGERNRQAVLRNSVVFGTVNANRDHYELATRALEQADHAWLADLVTRRVTLDDAASDMTPGPDDVKVVLDLPA